MKKLIKFDDGNATLFGAIYRYTELQRIGSSYYLISLNKIYSGHIWRTQYLDG